MTETIRVGIIGCGTIGGYVFDEIFSGKVKNTQVVMVCGRSDKSKGRKKVIESGIPWTTSVRDILKTGVEVVVEAASHEALESYGEEILENGIDLIPSSLGALVDSMLLDRFTNAAEAGGSRLHIPSGGIGGLDALQAAIQTDVASVTMTSRKPPVAWKGIPYVSELGVDLENVGKPIVLYEGPARDCVKKFPQNINIAAALSLAGIGFEQTQIRILVDPEVTRNTHEIQCRGTAGQFTIIMENIPVPENPKTTYMACLSVLATLKRIKALYRVGT